MAALKTLFWDLETAPLLAHIWSPTDQYVTHDRTLHDSFILSWSAKWSGGEKVTSMVLTSEEAKAQDDTRIVVALADLIRKADIIVAHNINQFDLPMLNNRLMALRLESLGPVTTIDTLKLARKNFRLAHNKLDYLAEFLGLGNKIRTEFSLWRRCYLGETKALQEMKKYNAHDVVLLEEVFNVMKPYVRGLTRMYDADRELMKACPTCGSEELVSRGTYRTQASVFGRLQCKGCGRYCRYRSSERSKKLSVHPL